MEDSKLNYTIINNHARVELGLTYSEYSIADIVYNLCNMRSNKGWCKMSKQWIGDQFGITKQSVNNILTTLKDKGLIEKKTSDINNSRGDAVRTTDLWYNTAIINKGGKKLSTLETIGPKVESLNEKVESLDEKGGKFGVTKPGYYNDINNDITLATPTERKVSGTIGEEEGESRPAKFKNTIGYMRAVPEEDILHWVEKFPVLSRDTVIREIGKAKGWLEANGKTKKDYQAFTRNWLDNAAERLEKQKGGGYGPRVSVQE